MKLTNFGRVNGFASIYVRHLVVERRVAVEYREIGILSALKRTYVPIEPQHSGVSIVIEASLRAKGREQSRIRQDIAASWCC